MIILNCKKSLQNACVDMQIKCKDENQLKAVFDWIMEENMQHAPKWVFIIESVEYEQEQEPWVCCYCGEVINNPLMQMLDSDGCNICRNCHDIDIMEIDYEKDCD